uniref:Ymf98 n=1 Tax=Phytopythium vexans TaxID=907947 RepID=UPI002029302C|nr:Ymf98 [Phytopythium vexans]DAZ89485.1 TPA_asm: Ymf98 [Phytopythium vexans]
MKNKFFKKYKLNQLQKIKQNYQYIYIFRYYDLSINEIILIKKKIKNLNYKSLILKQNLITNYFPNIKSQNSILILYGNEYNLNIIKDFLTLKKIELIYLKNNNNIYSNLKIKKIISNNDIPLNSLIVKPLLNFLYYLRKI